MKKLAIVTTHPIQYNAPWFKLLTSRNIIDIKVFYTWSQSQSGVKYDPGFGKDIEWDIPLLEGYGYEFVENTSKDPGTRSHNGIINPQLINKILEFEPDALLISGWNFKSHLQCLRYFHKKIPVLFRGDSTLLDIQNPLKAFLRKIVLTKVFKKVDMALYVGKENKKYFLKHGLKEQQLFFIPHAIDNERFSVESNNKEAADQLRHELGLSENAFVFLFAGKFELKKNPEILMKAAQHTGNDVHFVFVGNGELEPFLKKAYGHIVNIHFLDFQNQKSMPVVYAMADVFVLPSDGPGETWGLAVNEAMACNKPVIVSNKCGCAIDLVKGGRNGYIFDAGNMNDLENTLMNFYSGKDNVLSMGNTSCTIIKEFSFEKIVSGIEAIMLKIKN